MRHSRLSHPEPWSIEKQHLHPLHTNDSRHPQRRGQDARKSPLTFFILVQGNLCVHLFVHGLIVMGLYTSVSCLVHL